MFLFHFFPSNPMLFHLFFGNKLVLPFEISFFSVKFEIFFSISIFLFGFAKPKLTRNKLGFEGEEERSQVTKNENKILSLLWIYFCEWKIRNITLK